MARFYTEKENRDPSIYLGIDDTIIPFEMFKGIYNITTAVFGSDYYGDETQFYIGKDGVSIATMNKDQYVTKEDLENDLWFLINHPVEYTTGFVDYTMIKDEKHDKIIQRYLNGEVGKITEEEKVYNDEGQYMRKQMTLDTLAGNDIRDRLYNISSFIFWNRPDLPWIERQVKLRINSVQERELYNLIFNSAMVEFLKIGGQEVTEDMKFQKMTLPSIGTVHIEIDDSLEDFILEKID